MSFRWNAILCHIILIVFDAVRMEWWNRPLMKWKRHLMKSNHIKAVCPLLTCNHDNGSLKRHNEDKKLIVISIILYSSEIQLGPIYCNIYLNATLFIPNCLHKHTTPFDAGLSIEWCASLSTKYLAHTHAHTNKINEYIRRVTSTRVRQILVLEVPHPYVCSIRTWSSLYLHMFLAITRQCRL